MNKIEKKKLYLSYLEEINEGRSREKKIAEAVQKINKFLVNNAIINYLINNIVDKDSSKGVKYLVWMANLVKDDIMANFHAPTEKYEFFFKEYITTGKINDNYSKRDFDEKVEALLDETFYNYYFEEVPIASKICHIVDWLKSPLCQDEEIDLSKYKTLNDAFQEAKAWYEELDATGHIDKEHGTVIKTFDDGWYWIDLETTEDLDEAKAMGHCGVTTQGTTLYSLRKNKSPHVTMAINTKDGYITQCKGRNNKKPIEKYHQYIFELLINDNFKADKFVLEFDTGDDFSINDLNEELFKKLITHNINWVDYNCDITVLHTVLKNNFELLKKISDIKLLFKLCQYDLFSTLVHPTEKGKMTEFMQKEIFTDDYFNKNYFDNSSWLDSKVKIKNSLRLKGDNIIIKFVNSAADLYYKKLFVFNQPVVKTSKEVSYRNVEVVERMIENYYDLNKAMRVVDDQLTMLKIGDENKFIFQDTLKKCVEVSDNKFSTPKEVHLYSKEFVDKMFGIKLEEEQEHIVKYIKDTFDVELNIDEKSYSTTTVKFKDFLNQLRFRNIYKSKDILIDWNNQILLKIKENRVKYVVKYDYLTELNNYILEKFAVKEVNEGLILEKFGVADDIEEWYELLFYIIKVQCEGFIKAVQTSPERYKSLIEIGEGEDQDEAVVFNCDIELDKKTANKLIKEYIPKKNILKLRDLSVKLSITILTEEYFTNYLFDNDAHYNEINSDFDGKFLRNSEFFLQVYLPLEVLRKDAKLENLMNDYEITMKLRQSISHEVDHAFEFFNRTKAGETHFPEKALNGIQTQLQNEDFSKISNDFYNFLLLCYLALTFEGSARVTELHYLFKEMENIDDSEQFWLIVKGSNAWKEMIELKNFEPNSFYNNIKFEMSDEDIKEVLIMTKIYTEEDFEKHSIKDLVIKHWLKLFDNMIKIVNKEYPYLNVKRIHEHMMDHPLLFFKYYDKKFKKSWNYFYNRVTKMSMLYIKD